MGLIKAIAGAAGGVLADQWKEYFYCDALDVNTIVVKGQKRVLLQARSNFASRRGTTEPEVRSSIEQLIERLSHPAS